MVKKQGKDKREELEQTIAGIKQKFGEGAIMTLKEVRRADVDAIPTGSISLDLALGVGGVPRGRVIEIFGPEASGKTTLSLHILAEAQKRGGVVAFVDAEHALDPDYAKRIGVKVEDLLIAQPDSGEQALQVVESLVRSGKVDVIVIDSVAALTPRTEIEGEMGDLQVGLQARMMSQACLAGNTELIDPVTGEISTIEEIVKQRKPWHSLTYDEKKKKLIVSMVTDWLDQGTKECLRIKTKDGHLLDLTDDHLVFTLEGWKRVKDLDKNDCLAIPRKIPQYESNTNALSNEEVKTIAYIIGDGNFTASNYNLGFTNVDPEIVNDLNSALQSLNCELYQKSYKDYRIRKKKSLPLGSYRSAAKELLRKMDVFGKKSPEKEIPPVIFQLPKRQLSIFISRLWSCDGHIDVAPSGRSIIYSSSSLKLIKQLQFLLLRFGIVARWQQKRPAPNGLYKLVVQGRRDIEIFSQEIGLVGKKAEKLETLASRERKSKVVPFQDTMPYQPVPWVKEMVYASGRTGMEVSPLLGLSSRTSFSEWKPSRLRPSREHLKEIGDSIQGEQNQKLVEDDVYWTGIESIRPIGKKPVYDLSIKDKPNFIANGVLVHNCRKLAAIVSKSKTCVIFLNQTRMKITAYGDPTTTPGGLALKFYASVRINLRRAAQIKSGDKIIGNRIVAKVVKNKVAAPFKRAEFDIYYNEGISREGDLIRAGLEYKVVKQSGAWYQFGDQKLGQGMEKSKQFLRENKKLAKEIEKEIIKRAREEE